MGWTIQQIIEGYSQGHFLMADSDSEPVAWYYTKRRTLIPLDDRFHCPRSLRRALSQNWFTYRINTAFAAVVTGCANRETTWISPELKQIYWDLYQAGWAHSFETWQGDQLAGGILGIAIRGVFIGESMFYQIPEGSKVAMVKLQEHLRSRGYLLFDAQLMNPHLQRFGAYETDDISYRKLLSQALSRLCTFT
ncbi:MAG: leucyl/phenylalanyl-tRNA--protein transferase [Oscillatoriales cyanobacterium SM2_2_1]|nr:leucyl/phenylalanyl-tRNA--protein transferase [Oscillatoriales cyanobacterium SM2_2_1]